MKAIRIHNYGGSESLVYEDVGQPEVGEGQVLVEVMATSVNHIDVMMSSGKMKDSYPLDFPWSPGVDFSGRIDYVSGNVEGFSQGDEIYGKLSSGSYAQYVAVDRGSFARMPANLSFTEAASVPHVGLTAWEAVYQHGMIEPGQKILIHGAAGAVGSFAVQFAKLAGAKVYSVVSGESMEYVESIGSDFVIDYKATDFTHVVKDIDLVLDFVGGDTASRSYPVMKKGGRLVTTTVQPDKTEAEKYGVTATYMGVEADFCDLSEITALIEAGKVKPDVALVMKLEEAARAWDIYNHKTKPEKEFSHGKIVLELQ